MAKSVKKQLSQYLILLGMLFGILSCGDKTVQVPGTVGNQKGGGTENQNRLALAVRAAGEPSASGKRSNFICALSENHLSYMISKGDISHDNFQDRSNQMFRVGGKGASEIVASNCGTKGGADGAAKKCVSQWNNSPPHKESMDKYWANYCYSMRQSKDGCWYCIGLFANGTLTRD